MKRIRSITTVSAFVIAAVGAFAFKPAAKPMANNSYKAASCISAIAFCPNTGGPLCKMGSVQLFQDKNTCTLQATLNP